MRGSGDSRGRHAWLHAATRGNGPYVVLLVLLNLLFFGDILFTENTYFYRDIAGYHHPLKKLVTEAYERGQWPLWNPYIQFGQPLLANPNAMALYPTQLLFHLLPFDWAFDLNLVLHALVGGIGAFYLARALNFSPIAALAVGIAFNFNGVVLSLVNLPLLAAMAGLFPWLALFLQKAIHNPSAIRLIGLSVLFCLLFMLLEPLTTAAVFLFLVPFGVYVFLTRQSGVSCPKVTLRLLLVLVSAVLLAGVQLVPAVEMINNSGRIGGVSFDIASFWSIHPLNLTQMLFPKVWEDTFDLADDDSLRFSAFSESREPYLVSCYGGLACLVMALLGLLYSEKIALKRLLVAISLIAVVLALGKYTPVYGWLYHHVSPFRYGRFPSKYLLTLAMSFSLLVGLGIDQLRALALKSRIPGGKRRFLSFLLVTASLLVFAGLLALSSSWEKAGFDIKDNLVKLSYQGSDVKLQMSLIREAVFYLCLVVSGSLIGVFVAWYRVGSSLSVVLVTALIFFDLLTNHSVNPVIPSRVYERPPVADWLLERYSDEGLSRVYHPISEGPIRILGKTDSLIWRIVFSRLAVGPYGGVGDH
ncbi:MAG: hypothetical protein EHM61_24625, partial [Acidobacteria bacterium]